jgi:hypothetical protein
MRLKTSDFGVFEKRLTDSRIGFCNTSALIPSGWLRCGVVNAASDDPGTHVLKSAPSGKEASCRYRTYSDLKSRVISTFAARMAGMAHARTDVSSKATLTAPSTQGSWADVSNRRL